MATRVVETYDGRGNLIETREVDVPDAPAEPLAVVVDPQALNDAQAAITAATTVTVLKHAVAAALDLLNPAT